MKVVGDYIVNWLNSYCENAGLDGFVLGISGGVDSALCSKLCALTGKKVLVLSLPILQKQDHIKRANLHIKQLKNDFNNVTSIELDLSDSFLSLQKSLPDDVAKNPLAMANSRARLRMIALYAVAQNNRCLVVGTGNKIEDFGVGFFTKYGDGGVDISPIADLNKTQVWDLARFYGISHEIVDAKPTDGLWDEEKTDEDQMGATYVELEAAMNFKGDVNLLSQREKEVLEIYQNLNKINRHKMIPIPVCLIPNGLI